MVDPTHSTRLAIVERDMDEVRRAITLISESHQDISKTLKEFAVVAHEQLAMSRALDRAFGEIKDMKDDISEIQVVLPGLKEKAGWMIAGLGVVITMIIIAIVALVIKAPT